MSRKRLAEVSTVSERYLAQLESGQGNMSIALLRKVTSAIGISMGALMAEAVTETCIGKIATAKSEPLADTAHEEPCSRLVPPREGLETVDPNSSSNRETRVGSSPLLGSSMRETVRTR